MFFFFALFAVGFILTLLASPKMKYENAKASTLDEFNFPRSKEGDPVARFYGTEKLLSPNTIGLSGYRAVEIKKKVKTGLFSSKTIITGYKYHITAVLAWALGASEVGPGVAYRKLWFGKNMIWTDCLYGGCYNEAVINLPELYGGSEDGKRGGIAGTIGMHCGSMGQEPDPYLAANVDAEIPGYVGTAYMVFRDFWWGNSPSIDAVSCEAQYITNSLELTGGRYLAQNLLDMNPVEVLYDIFTYGWGNLGYDPSKINVAQWREKAYQVWEEDNGITLTVTSRAEAKDAVKTILRQINGVLYEDQTTGLVELDLLRNDYELEDLEEVGADQVVEVRSFNKKLWNQTSNVVRIKYIDRDDNYAKDKIAIAKDSSLLRFQGRERPTEITMPGVRRADLANELAARELSNLNVPLYSAEITLNRNAGVVLRPGRPFVWSCPEYGIVQMVMRVRKINMGTLEDGKITMQILQDEFSLASTVIAPPAGSGHVSDDYTPGIIEDHHIFELPAWLDYNSELDTRPGYARFATMAEKPTANSMSYNAYLDDGDDDLRVLNSAPYSATAALVGAIARFDGWATGTLASVVIEALSDETVLELEGTQREGAGLMLMGNEITSFAASVDNLDGTFTLTGVRRTLMDTGWEAHAAGDKIYFFNGQEGFFDSDIPQGVATTFYLIDKTATGSGSEADADPLVVTGVGRNERVIAPDYVTADGSRTKWQEFALTDIITLDARPRNRNDVLEIWYEDDASSTPEAGTLYKITEEIGGVETLVADDETLPYDYTATTEELIVLHIYAKRDGEYSLASAPMPIIVGDWLTIDGEPVLIDGEGIMF